MSRVTFAIDGKPYALKRARHTNRGITYDPKENRQWKAKARGAMRIAMGDRPPLEGPVRLTVRAHFHWPKSQHRKRNPKPSTWHTKKPDLDNILKAVEDAGNGLLWVDDSQVCDTRASKCVCSQSCPFNESTIVTAEEITDPPFEMVLVTEAA